MSRTLEELMTQRYKIGGQVVDRFRLGIGGPLGFSNGRLYRQPVLVGVSNSVVTDYQVKLTVTFVTDKMNADFSDLLFEDDEGNDLPYWIESKTDSSTATVWVKIATTSTTQKQTIYMYYGSEGATSSSSIDDVMDAGLRFFYYDGTGFNTYQGTGIDTSINHSWGGTVSIAGVGSQSDTLSVIWRGWVLPYGVGSTIFYTSSDDGQRLYLNGGLVINNWSDQGETERNYTYNLQGPTPIEYQFYENGGGAVARLGWDPVSGGKVYPIPSTYLRCRKYVSAEPSLEFQAEEEASSIWDGLLNSIQAEFTMQTTANSYRYIDLTNVSDYTIVSGDVLEYDIYWEDANCQIAMDLLASGWNLRDSGLTDQNGLTVHPAYTTINTNAFGQWYSRRIPLTGSAVGKVITSYCLVCENNSGGTYTGFFANIRIVRSGVVVKTIWESGAITTGVSLNSGTNSHTFTPDVAK